MIKTFVIAMCAVLFTTGCNKKEQQVNNPTDQTLTETPTAAAQPPSGTQKTRVAEGEMEELLLALTRVHFSFDAASLSSTGRNALNEAAEKLNAHPEVALFVDGHTDARGTTEYNLSLGDRRAQTVIDYLTRMGIDRERLRRISFGEEHLLSDRAGRIANAKNRRVDFRLMEGDVELVLREGALIDDDGDLIQTLAKAGDR